MGTGRPNKKVENISGHRTEFEKEKKRMVEEKVESLRGDRSSILKPPSYLRADAKKEWKRIAPLLEKMDLGELDLSNIEGYCTAKAMYNRATKELADQPLLITKVVRGMPIEVENPLIKVQRDQAKEMRSFGNLIGMTASSRYTICTSKVNKEQEEINDEFGDI